MLRQTQQHSIWNRRLAWLTNVNKNVFKRYAFYQHSPCQLSGYHGYTEKLHPYAMVLSHISDTVNTCSRSL